MEKLHRVRIKSVINRSVVKSYVESLNSELRVSKEFLQELDGIVKCKVSKAVQRQKSFKGCTLKKDQLYM